METAEKCEHGKPVSVECGVRCHACGDLVKPIQTIRTVMRHQCVYVNGFSLSVNDTECPKCGERGI